MDYSFVPYRCVEEIQNNTWVLPAIKLAKDLCCLFSEATSNFVHHQVVSFRGEMLRALDSNYQVSESGILYSLPSLIRTRIPNEFGKNLTWISQGN